MLIKKIVHQFIIRYKTRNIKSVGKVFSAEKGINIVGPQYIKIGDHFSPERNLYLQAWDKYNGQKTGTLPELIIGNNVSMMSNCQISCLRRVEIGDGALFGDNVFVTDNFHGKCTRNELSMPPLIRKLYSKGPVKIGNNVWIGRNVCIMPGVTIGDGAVIGANAVVTKNVASYTVAAGVPAKVVKTLAL